MPRMAIVYVHGILSSCSNCFPEMTASLKADPILAECTHLWFDYDYNQEIARSGEQLAAFLNDALGPDYEACALVCHSMGGLVARSAILSGEVPRVRKLIMLGTPNFGACRTSRSALLMQVALLTAGHISSVFRKPGILDLTRVTAVMAEPIREGAARADDVDYATIAGTYFHESRGILEGWTGAEKAGLPAVFRALQIGIELTALVPLWRPAIDRPHDGIVEEQSCAMAPCGPGRHSEKDAAINHPGDFGKTYAHIFHEACDDLMHVTLQGNSDVIELVKGLLIAKSLPEWRRGLSRDLIRRIKVSPEDLGA